MLANYQNILVALDGSEAANLAFEKALQIARVQQASLTLAHVIDTRAFQNIATFDETLADQASSMAKEMLEEALQEAKNAGIGDVSYVLEYGNPKAIIAKDLPDQQNTDLIILGATGLNAIERLLIGSVSSYVIRHATCDVLVVRSPLESETA